MKNLPRLLVLTGLVALVCWGYPTPVAAFPMTCGSIPSCSTEQGKACTVSAICCIAGLPLQECTCVKGHLQCTD
jgi:hypothetical protein